MSTKAFTERVTRTRFSPRTYQRVVVTERGDLGGVHLFTHELRDPAPGEVRVRVLASGVHQDDVAAHIGNRPTLPKLPFTPGYDIVGDVDMLGDDVKSIHPGDRVAALTVIGGHAEYIYLPEEQLTQVPLSLDPAEAVTLILNYLVAYQVLHRVARVKSGDSVLVIGASGGVGTAFLQLGRVAGLKMYGTASLRKHDLLRQLGAIPIDYVNENLVEAIHRYQSGGVDVVCNGMGEEYIRRGIASLRRGGTLVHYGGPQSLARLGLLLFEMLAFWMLPNGKTIKGYGTHRVPPAQLKQDWAALFRLLQASQIKPVIARRLRLVDDAVDAYALLESGSVSGNIVLVAPELLSTTSE